MDDLSLACAALVVACHALAIGLLLLLDSFWREIEIGAGAWWEG